MFSKNISAFLMVVGFVALTSADAPCDGKPYAEDYNCTDHKGKFVLTSNMCIENHHFTYDGIVGVQCLKPGYAFNTEEDCKEKCSDEIKDVPSARSPMIVLF